MAYHFMIAIQQDGYAMRELKYISNTLLVHKNLYPSSPRMCGSYLEIFKQAKVMVAAAAGVDDVGEDETGPAESNFDYLLSMAIQSLTLEKVFSFRQSRLVMPIK